MGGERLTQGEIDLQDVQGILSLHEVHKAVESRLLRQQLLEGNLQRAGMPPSSAGKFGQQGHLFRRGAKHLLKPLGVCNGVMV